MDKKRDDSEKLYVGDKPPSDFVLRRIESLFFISRKPLYLGTIALEIGYGLNQTQGFIDGMQEANVVRRLSQKEIDVMGLRHDGIIYAWVDKLTA